MKINIERVVIKNFLSYGNKPSIFELNIGLNLITGLDKDSLRINGVGKSSSVDSIIWALYGKTAKDINKPQVINWKNKKKCVVQIEFSINETQYKVIRGLKPNILKIYVDGKELDSLSSNNDIQKYLEEQILQIDYKTFVSLIYCNPNNFISIFDVTKSQKRKFLENLFSLETYSEMKKEFNTKISSTKDSILELKTSISKNSSQIDSLNKQNKQFKFDLENISSIANIEEIEQELFLLNVISFDINLYNEYKKKIKKIEKVLSSNRVKLSMVNEYSNIDNKILNIIEEINSFLYQPEYCDELKHKVYELEAEIKNIENILNDIETNEKYDSFSKCPICGNKLEENHVHTFRTNKLEKYSKQLEEKNIELEKIRNKYLSIKESNDKHISLHKQLEVFKKQKEENKLFQKYSNIEKKLISVKNDVMHFFGGQEEEKIKYEKAISRKNELEQKLEYEKKALNERQSNIDRLNEYIENNKYQISLLTDEIKEYSKKKGTLEKLLEYYSFLRILCGDDQIKQYAISNIIPILNQKVNYYLSESGLPFYVKLDGWLDCEIKGPGISNASANNLSGGEKKSLELALQFALYDIIKIKSKNLPNILILDELLDSSIDEDGIDKIMNIVALKQKEDKLGIFIISHRKEINQFTIDNTYFIYKQNGYSSISNEE